jgi:hypothetical protein
MNLVLDFVPNHVAPDHPWAAEHPEYFIRGGADDLKNDPSSFLEINGTVYACGRDPYFPAWPDVLQLNAFNPGLRQAVVQTILSIAQQCDGVRCDMAMLMLNPALVCGVVGSGNSSALHFANILIRLCPLFPRLLDKTESPLCRGFVSSWIKNSNHL